MKKSITFLFTTIIALSSIGQTIRLIQRKSDNDIKIISGEYIIYVNGKDVVSAISKIDSVMKTNNAEVIIKIRNNELKTLDMDSKQPSDKAFIDLLRSNLGTLLLLQGKAGIYKGSVLIRQIVADQGPEERKLDGTSSAPVVFAEEGADKTLFLGHISINPKVIK